jgi:hypothetical protein
MLSITSRTVRRKLSMLSNLFSKHVFLVSVLRLTPTIHHSNIGAHSGTDTNYTHLPCKHVVVNGKTLEQQGRWVRTSWQDSNAVVVTLGSPVHSNAKSTPPPVISLITCLHTTERVMSIHDTFKKEGLRRNWNLAKVVRPSDFADMCIPVWIQGGTLLPIIDDHAMAWPLHPVMDMSR